MVKKIIYVSACVIVDIDNRILVATREHKSDFKTYWEFPGGKLNKNETPEDCLIREIKEEVGLNISIKQHLCQVKHAYSHFKVSIEAFISCSKENTVDLKSAAAFCWVL